MDYHSGSTEPTPISYILATKRKPKPIIFAATKWIQVRNPFSGEKEYIKQMQSGMEIIDTIDEIDANPSVLSTCQVNDYISRRYPLTRMGEITRTRLVSGGMDHTMSHKCFNTVTRTWWINPGIRNLHSTLLLRSSLRCTTYHRG